MEIPGLSNNTTENLKQKREKFVFRKFRGCTIFVAKTKALISFTVTWRSAAPLFLHMQKTGFLMNKTLAAD